MEYILASLASKDGGKSMHFVVIVKLGALVKL